MRTNTDDLPKIDPTRTHLDILRDVLRMMQAHQPTSETRRQDLDCAVCGFPLTGCVKPGLVHATFKNHLASKAGCDWLRGIAELDAWVRVEEQLDYERREREENDEPEPPTAVEVALAAEREAIATMILDFASNHTWVESPAATGVVAAIRSRTNERQEKID